jgi:cysteinyl-tRNA synthetase
MAILKLTSITRRKNAKKPYKRKHTVKVTKISHEGVVTMRKAQNMRNLMALRDKINTQKAVSNMINLTNNNNMVEKVNKNSKTTKEQYMTKRQIMKKARNILSNFPKEKHKKSQDSQIRRGL